MRQGVRRLVTSAHTDRATTTNFLFVIHFLYQSGLTELTRRLNVIKYIAERLSEPLIHDIRADMPTTVCDILNIK